MTRMIDISPVVSGRIGVFPGDTPYERTETLRLADGANIDLSHVTSTVHVGAHADAPSHYKAGGEAIHERPLDLYYGPCQVIHAEVPMGERIPSDQITEPIEAPRVLFRTGTFPDPENYNEDFAALSPDLVERLAGEGVRLVGIDTPSIDLCRDEALECHQVVARHDMGILEGLVLQHVDPGLYTLVALPLKLEGADAAPVRAVLLADDPA